MGSLGSASTEAANAIWILLLISAPFLLAQQRSDLWHPVDPNYHGLRLHASVLSARQTAAIARLAVHCCADDLSFPSNALPDVVRFPTRSAESDPSKQ